VGALKNSARPAAPAALSDAHQLDAFRCNEPDLEIWLKQRARRNQLEGASRTFVVCAGDEVVGYYCLAAGAVMHEKAPGNIRRNMPDPIPVAILGRLAVHVDWQGQGIGSGLLKDAIVRTLRLAEEMGIRALLAHALHDKAKQFYLHHGFMESPIDPLTLMLNIAKLAKAR
jgi:GNAT superfamily N-acetyltransferase